MHELTRCSDFDPVEIHVGQEDPAQIVSDLVVCRDGEAFPVEVTVCLGDDVVDPRDGPRVNQLYDAVERVERGGEFVLYVDVRDIGPDTLGRRTVTRFLDRWLAGLDPDDELARADRGEPPARTTFDRLGWKVHFTATGVQPELRGAAELGVIGGVSEGLGGYTHRIVGEKTVEFDGPRPLSDDALLARTLLDKAGHGYDAGHRPLMIAVMCAGDFVEDREIVQALLGPIEYWLGGSGHYQPGGLWREGAGWRYTRVAAVLTFAQLSPISVAVVEPTLWLNLRPRIRCPPTCIRGAPWRSNSTAGSSSARRRAPSPRSSPSTPSFLAVPEAAGRTAATRVCGRASVTTSTLAPSTESTYSAAR